MSCVSRCSAWTIGVGCMTAMAAYAYSSLHGSCDESAFISTTVGAVASVVSAVAYSAIAVCSRREALPVRLLTATAALAATAAAALYVTSDVIVGDVVFGENSLHLGGEYPCQAAINLQTVSVSIMSAVLGLFTLGAFCCTELSAGFVNRWKGSQESMETML